MWLINTGHYVQMGVVVFIEDDAQLAFVRLFLFHWLKQSIYCRINNPEWIIAIPELKISFNVDYYYTLKMTN